ncbi:MAG: ZIP family metal transporter [Gammaproteobacteria bacterium]|nr:ZIP family metal transporter [Gammaproteobacteria bacterium]
MSPLFWIISATLFGGLLSATAAGGILLVPEPIRTRLLPSLLSFAIGALLGAAFLGLLPHALEQPLVEPMQITATLLGGILLFFLLEKLVLWRHCHTESCEAHNPDEASIRPSHSASGALILLGDSTHNFLDGVLIGSAFLTDIRLGILTTIAVTAHEIPQEIGDFTILLHSGFSRMRALVLNLLVSLTTVAGGLLAYYAFNEVRGVLPYLMALAAASFIYVAVADLIPNLHKRMGLGETLRQLLLISAGISIIALAHRSLS